MIALGGAEIAEVRPEMASLLFENIQQAANMVFPGSDSHPRYEDPSKPVGLAVVVAREAEAIKTLDVFDPSSYELTSGGLTFHKNNRSERTEKAWVPAQRHKELLDGEVNDGIGVFSMFALAKVIHLMQDPGRLTSFEPDRANIARGVSGLAGGYRFRNAADSGTLVAVSGLWEVHDHVTTAMFYRELTKKGVAATHVPSPDKLAEEIKDQVGKITKVHEGEDAKDLDQDRKKLKGLLQMITPVLTRQTM
ncbi:hypothetical protein KY385_01130 [Candidatus Parcubacteria bacterium]|nr:hypothetical protein [Candidatus Parcubacteria bacterium]